MKKIIFLGDSITDAEHCFSENPLGNGYVEMVDKKLNHSTGGGKKYDIVNCGHDGFTIQGVKRMLEHDCILRQPDIVSLLIGCNDVGVMMNTGKSLEEQEFEAGYESVLRELTERTRARIICMAPFIFPYPRKYANWIPGIRQAEAIEGSRCGPETTCGASSRTTQPDRASDCRTRFQASGTYAGTKMAARHAGSTRTVFLLVVPQAGGRESQSLREEWFQRITGYGGSHSLGQQRFHE